MKITNKDTNELISFYSKFKNLEEEIWLLTSKDDLSIYRFKALEKRFKDIIEEIEKKIDEINKLISQEKKEEYKWSLILQRKILENLLFKIKNTLNNLMEKWKKFWYIDNEIFLDWFNEHLNNSQKLNISLIDLNNNKKLSYKELIEAEEIVNEIKKIIKEIKNLDNFFLLENKDIILKKISLFELLWHLRYIKWINEKKKKLIDKLKNSFENLNFCFSIFSEKKDYEKILDKILYLFNENIKNIQIWNEKDLENLEKKVKKTNENIWKLFDLAYILSNISEKSCQVFTKHWLLIKNSKNKIKEIFDKILAIKNFDEFDNYFKEIKKINEYFENEINWINEKYEKVKISVLDFLNLIKSVNLRTIFNWLVNDKENKLNDYTFFINLKEKLLKLMFSEYLKWWEMYHKLLKFTELLHKTTQKYVKVNRRELLDKLISDNNIDSYEQLLNSRSKLKEYIKKLEEINEFLENKINSGKYHPIYWPIEIKLKDLLNKNIEDLKTEILNNNLVRKKRSVKSSSNGKNNSEWIWFFEWATLWYLSNELLDDDEWNEDWSDSFDSSSSSGDWSSDSNDWDSSSSDWGPSFDSWDSWWVSDW